MRASDLVTSRNYDVGMEPNGLPPSSEILAGFGRRVALARERRGYKTQASFAEAMEVHPTAANHWEGGRNLPQPAQMLRMCRLLRVTMDWLLFDDESGLSQEAHTLLARPASAQRRTKR